MIYDLSGFLIQTKALNIVQYTQSNATPRIEQGLAYKSGEVFVIVVKTCTEGRTENRHTVGSPVKYQTRDSSLWCISDVRISRHEHGTQHNATTRGQSHVNVRPRTGHEGPKGE